MRPYALYLLAIIASFPLHHLLSGWAEWLAPLVLGLAWPWLLSRQAPPLKGWQGMLLAVGAFALSAVEWLLTGERSEVVTPFAAPFLVLLGWPLVDRLRGAETLRRDPLTHLLMGVALLFSFASARAAFDTQGGLAITCVLTFVLALSLPGTHSTRGWAWLAVLPSLLLQLPTALVEGATSLPVYFYGLEPLMLLLCFGAGWSLSRSKPLRMMAASLALACLVLAVEVWVVPAVG